MYIEEVTVSSVLAALKEMGEEGGNVCQLLIGEHTPIDVPGLVRGLSRSGLKFFGGVFPGLIYGEEWKDRGAIVKKIRALQPPLLVKKLSTGQFSDMDKLTALPRSGLTALITLDGLTSNISKFLEELNNLIGDKASFLGGGAGYLDAPRRACVFTQDGCEQDAASLCVVDGSVSLGIRHGWREFYGPIVATKTAAHVIYELNWEPAFKVYAQAVETDLGKMVSRENFFEISNRYPLGMFRENAGQVVRDPIKLGPENELICIGEVPSNTVMYILKGEKSDLLASAEAACADCLHGRQAGKIYRQDLVVDCITRALFLGADFRHELKMIQKTWHANGIAAIPEGVLSLGEIASSGPGSLEFYNKTVVVGLME